MGDSDEEQSGRQELADERTDLAEERTEWADQRTYLAQERTFGGWLRTGLASIAVGLGILELMREVEPQWLVSTMVVIFIFVGGLVQVIAFWSYRKVSVEMKKTDRPDMSISIWSIAAITVGMLACAVAGIVLVFFSG